ncbi:50S ribosome-binding protein YggL [Hymenobacter canadensis]|uniref:50S ribosome-binding protein YggL n=1 Tax=Hymenobacter canadensis TaxID=2999067 RepID=A0ABY7LS77_9BACT|nr:50S ribosome-binding protein YggL [Hymenobacter canadensis]WBA41580.1 50S ribosome-binding protein YggL [Hymenobacter canadensis]
MKKRLRKKTYRSEFQEFGWYVTLVLKSDAPQQDSPLWEPLMAQVDDQDLMMGGSLVSFFVQPVIRITKEQTQDRQQQLQQWLTQRPEVAQATSSALTDAWYGPFPQ